MPLLARYIFRSCCALIALIMLGAIAAPHALHQARAAAPTDLFFSEYMEGSSNNKALEIYNGTSAPINLATGGYKIQMCFNGSTTCSLTINLTGTVAAGDVFVLAQSSANAAILAQADQTNGSGWFNGDDAVTLVKGSTVLDVIGQVGFDPGTEWGSGLTSTADNTLRRKSTVCAGDINGSDVFNPATEWDGFATDTSDGLGVHTADCGVIDNLPAVSSTVPTSGAANVSLNTDVTVKFTEPVTVSGLWFNISCSVSGSHNAVVSGSGDAYTLNPDVDFSAGESCTVTVYASGVADTDGIANNMAGDASWSFATSDVCGDPATAIGAIQGNGASSPIAGSTRTIEGVVVGDSQGSTQFRGFWVQDAGDSDLATSDGIFVFNSTINVNIGDRVRVTGKVTEFNGLTELSPANRVDVCSTGNALPGATSLDLPVASLATYEAVEGMLVTIPETLTVSEVFTLGRFGEVLLSADGRLWNPTQIAEPGADANAVHAANLLRSILLDDNLNIQNPDPTPYMFDGPTLRLGDTTTGLTGVMYFAFNEYRIEPMTAPTFTRSNPRTSAPAFANADVVVASFNVLNYFNGDGLGGGFPTARGANTYEEFQRQRAKEIAAITEMNADVIGLMEMENDASPNSAIEDLVSGLNDATAPGTYSFINTGIVGGDAIRVALIYKPGAVTPVGNWATITTGPFSNRSRPPLAQAFRSNATGDVFVVVVNHFKSKGCDGSSGADTDQGDGQGCWNQVRVQSALDLAAWLATDPTGTGDSDVLLIGDLNSYLKEDPIDTLENAGFVNLLETLIGDHDYSYVFDGESGSLDHALASTSLAAKVEGVEHWHINADEPIVLDYNMEFKSDAQDALNLGTPYRSSDHDPVLIGLDFTAPAWISVPFNITQQGFGCDINHTRSDGCFFRFDYITPANKTPRLLDLRVWSGTDKQTLLTGYTVSDVYTGVKGKVRSYDVTFRDWQLFGAIIDGAVPNGAFSFVSTPRVYFEFKYSANGSCDLVRGWYDYAAQSVAILEVTGCTP